MSFCLWLSGKKVRNVRELIANYDSASLAGYFLGGGLLKWLLAAGEYEIASKVKYIEKKDALNIEKELAKAFGVPEHYGEYEQTAVSNTERTGDYNGSESSFTQEYFSRNAGSALYIRYSSAALGNYGSYTSSSGTLLYLRSTSYSGYGSGFIWSGSYYYSGYSGSFVFENYYINSFNYKSFLSGSMNIQNYLTGSMNIQNYTAGSCAPYFFKMLFRPTRAAHAGESRTGNTDAQKTEEAYKNISELLESPINRYGYGIYLI